ncbi:MAG: PAS domain S-box protein [Acidobacteriota bacterium]
MVTARLPFVPLVLFATGCGAVGASLALGYPLWAAVGVAAAGLAVWTLNRARPGAVEGLPPTRPAAVPSAPDTSGDRTADDPAASEELMRHEVGLEDVVETMAGALILASPERRIVRLNKAALDLLGDPGEELLGRPLSDIFPDERPMNSGSLLHLSTGGRMRSVERLFRHRDGSDVPVLFSGSALRGGDGELRQFVCVAYDIRPLKELEGQLRRSLGEKQLLLREVHHRVKNNLQVISSLLELQSERVEDERHLELLRDSK